MTLLSILSSEIESHSADYSTDQLSVIKKVLVDLKEHSKSNSLMTTPECFLPWHELEINIHGCIGDGGFGRVYRASWLDSKVVVKKLQPVGSGSADQSSMSSSSSMTSAGGISQCDVVTDLRTREAQKQRRQMFVREVTVWFRLSHPHVVRLFGACHIGTPYFACEYASNGSLDKYLRGHPGELWEKLHEAALGVKYLHSRGIVHGDLKCNNILVGGDGKAKVTDFGLSFDGTMLAKSVSGAWHWVAPECLRDHGSSQLSPASDIYALGMCMIEAMRVVEIETLNLDATMSPPYPWGAFTCVEARYHAKKRKLPDRPQLCSDDQWELVKRMCAHDPTSRLEIGAVVDELFKLASNENNLRDPGMLRQTFGRFGGGLEHWASCMAGYIQGWRRNPTSAVIADMKNYVQSAAGAASSGRETLTKIIHILWVRLEHLSSVVEDDGSNAAEQLREIVDTANNVAAALRDTPDTLIPFTETAMRIYSLHRKLDKLIAAHSWCDVDRVHDWK